MRTALRLRNPQSAHSRLHLPSNFARLLGNFDGNAGIRGPHMSFRARSRGSTTDPKLHSPLPFRQDQVTLAQ